MDVPVSQEIVSTLTAYDFCKILSHFRLQLPTCARHFCTFISPYLKLISYVCDNDEREHEPTAHCSEAKSNLQS